MITEEDCFNTFEGLRELVAEVERIAGPGTFESPSTNTLGLGWWDWENDNLEGDGVRMASINLPGLSDDMSLNGKGRPGATMPWLSLVGTFKAGVMPTIEEARVMAEWLMGKGDGLGPRLA